MEDVEDIEGLKAVASVSFSQAIERRQQIRDHLQTALADNNKCLDKLRSLAEMKDLFAENSKTGSFSVKKRLEEVVEELNKEVKEADEMWNGLNYTVHQQIDEVCCVFDTFQSIFSTMFLFVFRLRRLRAQQRRRGNAN